MYILAETIENLSPPAINLYTVAFLSLAIVMIVKVPKTAKSKVLMKTETSKSDVCWLIQKIVVKHVFLCCDAQNKHKQKLLFLSEFEDAIERAS